MSRAFAVATKGLVFCALVMFLLGYGLAAAGLTVLALATAAQR